MREKHDAIFPDYVIMLYSKHEVLRESYTFAQIFLMALVASAAANKTEDCSSFTALDLVPARTDYDQLVQSELQFTADLYRKIGMRRSADNINVMFTPFNIYNALLIMYFMSANRTEQIIEELFHIPKNQVAYI